VSLPSSSPGPSTGLCLWTTARWRSGSFPILFLPSLRPTPQSMAGPWVLPKHPVFSSTTGSLGDGVWWYLLGQGHLRALAVPVWCPFLSWNSGIPVPCRWVQEFLNEENCGLDVLLEYLAFAQCSVT
jgi:hypothetical protein